MREIRRSALVAATPEQMFGLINDVERYPEFVPGCAAAEVLEQSGQTVRARLTVGGGALRTSFVTRNRLHPHFRIEMDLDEGPLKSLHGGWTLTPVSAGDLKGCRVDLELRFELQAGLKGLAMGPLIERMAASLVDAFARRAIELSTAGTRVSQPT